MSVSVYFLGEKTGVDIKIGVTKRGTLRDRIREVEKEMSPMGHEYVPLAAVAATPHDERYIKRFFKDHNACKGDYTEYFKCDPPVVNYTNWLRSQYWACIDPDEDLTTLEMVHPDHWLPDGNGRAIPPPERDDGVLVQNYEDPSDILFNTVWSWMAGQRAGVQSFFTDPKIIEAARVAMAGIDLDAASEPLANRTHRIPDYFHTGRSAFHNTWHGKVWLNPPYGDNAPWFECIRFYVASGEIEQLCMISPMWAFQTKIARPVMELSSGLILLSPTPKFWGNKDPNRTGTNNPHGIIYIGSDPQRFRRAFAEFGFPMQFVWDDVTGISSPPSTKERNMPEDTTSTDVGGITGTEGTANPRPK